MISCLHGIVVYVVEIFCFVAIVAYPYPYIFIHQTKYTKDLLKRFDMGDCKPIATPMATSTALDPDEEGEAVDQHEYCSMIGSLLYLTASRSDIHFTVCLCARF